MKIFAKFCQHTLWEILSNDFCKIFIKIGVNFNRFLSVFTHIRGKMYPNILTSHN